MSLFRDIECLVTNSKRVSAVNEVFANFLFFNFFFAFSVNLSIFAFTFFSCEKFTFVFAFAFVFAFDNASIFSFLTITARFLKENVLKSLKIFVSIFFLFFLVSTRHSLLVFSFAKLFLFVFALADFSQRMNVFVFFVFDNLDFVLNDDEFFALTFTLVRKRLAFVAFSDLFVNENEISHSRLICFWYFKHLEKNLVIQCFQFLIMTKCTHCSHNSKSCKSISELFLT